MAYKSFADLIKPQEEEPIMSEMAPADYENMQSPVAPEMLYSTPKLADALPPKPEQPEVPMLAEADTQQTPPSETPMSKSEALIAEYNKLLGKSQEDLAEARRSDRMLKIGGALGDALATYLNAQGQMNVKAPGVQVQQGAGLGKVADMFATAPEIQSDIAQRREAMMKQYEQLARGESKAADRALQERKVSAYEAQTKAQTKKTEADTAKEARKESEKLSVGEETLDREFAKEYKDWTTAGKADYEENKKIFDEAVKALESGKVKTGALEGVGARAPIIRTDTRELETRVRKGLNGMLRATLGAQFTQEEGERIFQQTFDPAAKPEENIKNMQTELNKIKKRKQLIEEQGGYFKQKGTLKGYQIPQTLEESEQKQTLSTRDQQALDWANKNPTDERSIQIKKRLGM